MSDVKRYKFVEDTCSEHGLGWVEESDNGALVESVHLDTALSREAALREELANEKSENQHLRNRIDQLVDDKLGLQQRLTAAEQRNADLIVLLRDIKYCGTYAVSTGGPHIYERIDDALKPIESEASE